MLTPLQKTKRQIKKYQSSAFKLITDIKTWVQTQRHRQLTVHIILQKPVMYGQLAPLNVPTLLYLEILTPKDFKAAFATPVLKGVLRSQLSQRIIP